MPSRSLRRTRRTICEPLNASSASVCHGSRFPTSTTSGGPLKDWRSRSTNALRPSARGRPKIEPAPRRKRRGVPRYRPLCQGRVRQSAALALQRAISGRDGGGGGDLQLNEEFRISNEELRIGC